MNDRKKSGGVSMTGASSLLIIFAVLCLTVFALLSLNTATADRRLSRQAADRTASYYAADARAHQMLGYLRAGTLPREVTEKDGLYTYSCSIDQNTVLEVAVRLTDNGQFEILRWQSVSTLDWQSDDSIHVWDGQDLS